MAGEKRVKRVSFVGIQKLAAGVALLCFAVILATGIMSEASVVSIAYRAMLAILCVSVVTRVVVSILETYEEMNSGKA